MLSKLIMARFLTSPGVPESVVCAKTLPAVPTARHATTAISRMHRGPAALAAWLPSAVLNISNVLFITELAKYTPLTRSVFVLNFMFSSFNVPSHGKTGA
jgi:hypothetical protein